jgi:hypothetical protein
MEEDLWLFKVFEHDAADWERMGSPEILRPRNSHHAKTAFTL